MLPLESQFFKELLLIKEKNLWRSPSTIEKNQGTQIIINNQSYLNFSSNDYLGLSNHPSLQEAALEAMQRFGFGATASRLVCGTTIEHQKLEEELATLKKTEAALLFSSGFATATSAIPALTKKGDVIILDKLAHASLIDGARASEATLRIFRHNDLNHLEEHLSWAQQKFPQATIWIITESIFSMDGDIAPLREIVELKERYQAFLFIDEAHALGVRGTAQNRMSGLLGELGLSPRVEIQMGTLGKALGSAGGYLCASQIFIDYLRHHARSFIYTTALPACVAAAARAAIKIINSQEGESLHKKLWTHIALLEKLLFQNKNKKSESAIIPFLLGEEDKAQTFSHHLKELGFFIPAIRYPTVARGKARLRITVTANHTSQEVQSLVDALINSFS